MVCLCYKPDYPHQSHSVKAFNFLFHHIEGNRNTRQDTMYEIALRSRLIGELWLKVQVRKGSKKQTKTSTVPSELTASKASLIDFASEQSILIAATWADASFSTSCSAYFISLSARKDNLTNLVEPSHKGISMQVVLHAKDRPFSFKPYQRSINATPLVRK